MVWLKENLEPDLASLLDWASVVSENGNAWRISDTTGMAFIRKRISPTKRQTPSYQLILESGVKMRCQGRRAFNLLALTSIVSARLSIIGEGLSLSTGRFCGRVSSPGMRNSL